MFSAILMLGLSTPVAVPPPPGGYIPPVSRSQASGCTGSQASAAPQSAGCSGAAAYAAPRQVVTTRHVTIREVHQVRESCAGGEAYGLSARLRERDRRIFPIFRGRGCGG